MTSTSDRITGHNVTVLPVKSEAAFGNLLLRLLETAGPSTARELARASGVSELIVRSVLQALTAVDCLHHEPAKRTYSLFCDLPAEASRSNEGGVD